MKYIDADKLTKAIEDKGLDCSFALKIERLDILALIDELQQEQPEVEGEVRHFGNVHYIITNQKQLDACLKEFKDGARVVIHINARNEE